MMNKLRQSFRRKKEIYMPESSRPHQWQTDEEGVRGRKCSFAVKVSRRGKSAFFLKCGLTQTLRLVIHPYMGILNYKLD